MESRWLLLAHSYAFAERLGDFTATTSDWLREPKRRDPDLRKLPPRLYDLLPVGLYVCDPDGLILHYNRRAAELWGRSPKLDDPADRFCGSYRMYRLDGNALPHAECPMGEVLRTGISVVDQEIVIERPDGSRGIALVNIEALKDDSGNILGAINCFQDLTERRRSEEIVQRLASIVESSDDAIITKNLDSIITSWNKGAERLFGYTAQESVGKLVTMLIPPDRQDEELAILERIVRGQRIDHYETVRICKKRRRIDVSLTVSPVKNAEGKIIGASKIVRDITERKASEAQVATLAREAEHRAKNVLATVQATVHLTHADTTDGMKNAIAGRIQALANVHSLFVQSRWTGASVHSLVTQELSPYCRDDDTRARIGGPQLLLETNASQSLAIALHELATNAAKYGALSMSQGRVQVEWSRAADGRFVLRWIESDGPLVTPPVTQGFGTHVMQSLIRDQLKGEMRFDWRTEGLICEIVLPA
jgi:PAS domain S-box-containing protein